MLHELFVTHCTNGTLIMNAFTFICTIDEDDVNEVVDCKTSEMPFPMSPFLLTVSNTSRCTITRGLLATLTTLHPRVWARLLCHRAPTRLCHMTLLYIKTKANSQSCPVTSQRGCRLRQAKERLLLSLCQRPVNVAINASFTRRNKVLKIVKKWVLRSPEFKMQPGSIIKKRC